MQIIPINSLINLKRLFLKGENGKIQSHSKLFIFKMKILHIPIFG